MAPTDLQSSGERFPFLDSDLYSPAVTDRKQAPSSNSTLTAFALAPLLSLLILTRLFYFDSSCSMAGSRRKSKAAAISYQEVDSDIDMQDEDRQVEASKGEL